MRFSSLLFSIVVILVVCCKKDDPNPGIGAGGTWEQLANFPDSIYLYGKNQPETPFMTANGKGYVLRVTVLDMLTDLRPIEVWEFNPDGDAATTWKKKTASPPVGEVVAAFSVGGQMFIFYNNYISGYYGSLSAEYSSHFIRYDAASDTWSNLNTPTMYFPNGEVLSFEFNGKAYVYYSYREFTTTPNHPAPYTFQKYDPVSDTWTFLSFPDQGKIPSPADAGFVFHERLYFMGTELWTFDPVEITWTEEGKVDPDMKTFPQRSALFVTNDLVYMISGDRSGACSSDIWTYNGEDWDLIGKLDEPKRSPTDKPTARSVSFYFEIDRKYYFGAGSCPGGPDNVYDYQDVWRFTPSAQELP